MWFQIVKLNQAKQNYSIANEKANRMCVYVWGGERKRVNQDEIMHKILVPNQMKSEMMEKDGPLQAHRKENNEYYAEWTKGRQPRFA